MSQYLLVLLCIILYGVATEEADSVLQETSSVLGPSLPTAANVQNICQFTPGKWCTNDPNQSTTQQLLCALSRNTLNPTAFNPSVLNPLALNPSIYNPAMQNMYFNGLWRTQNSVNLMEKVGSDYLLTPGIGAHKLHSRKLTWNQARKICIQEGGHLTVINSNSEEKLVLRLLDENKISSAWVGLHDLYEEGDWNTILDDSMASSGYTRWSSKIPNLPDNHGGKQHCGILLKDGGLDDLECSLPSSFICEINF